MNNKLILLFAAVAAGASTVAAFGSARSRKASLPVEDVKNWENEGGNVPTVPTPSPQA